MPHSSGGGSHGGGSHGGSHGGYHGGSHGGGRGAATRTSSKYFSGSKKYVYYRNRRPVYVYSDDRQLTNQKLIENPGLIIFYIPFLFTIFFGMKFGLNIPHKITMDYRSEVIIEDNAGVLENEDELMQVMTEFRDKTGVTPMILTVNNEDWMGRYYDLEKYAYEAYVTRFYDEKHWLIVYSQPEYPDSDWVDWYWEGMQGDNTDFVVTEGMADTFRDELQVGLYQLEARPVDVSMANAFRSAIEYSSHIHVDTEEMMMSIVMLIFISFHAFFMLGIHPNAGKYKNAFMVPLDTTEDTCMYCQGVYVVGTCIECPHCGAPIRAHNVANTDV